MKNDFFRSAKPVFVAGMEDEMNVQLGFFARVPAAPSAHLVITGASMYRISINGAFFATGPARTCHGKFRVDDLFIGDLLTREQNVITIELQVSNCNSFALIHTPGFLQAEVIDGERVLARTDADGDFTCVHMTSRVQKTLRLSFQRAFAEVYRLSEAQGHFASDPEGADYPTLPLFVQEPKQLLPRDVYSTDGEVEYAQKILETGTTTEIPDAGFSDKREYHPSCAFRCFSLSEIEVNSAIVSNSYEYHPAAAATISPDTFTLPANGYALLDMSHELTGYLTLSVHTTAPTRLCLFSDELLRDGKVEPIRLDLCNILIYDLGCGDFELLTMEPYSLRYTTIVAQGEGQTTISAVGVRRVGFPPITKKLRSDDPEEQRIFAAAVETFRQNTADIYMDCPSRERAGWLCDSFFTSRVEYALTGKCVVERAFLDNFILAEKLPHVPEGMLPMCYPADHTDGIFIPNWAMFYVLELEEYLRRSGDRDLIDRARARMMALCDFLAGYENDDGLLEKLPSWVFVEWSRANELVQDVSFPSNACYSAVLDAMDRMYHLPDFAQKAKRIRAHIRDHARIGEFFCDNAVRSADGTLALSGDCTEVCQYYMFYFGVASPESDPQLWHILADEFGPDRMSKGLYPHIFPANSFIGNYLRQDLLDRYGRGEQILREIKGYFLYMADTTGTLWEHATDNASCNHGFASHVAVWLLKLRGEA